jgi:hypothetical protein
MGVQYGTESAGFRDNKSHRKLRMVLDVGVTPWEVK